MSERVVIAARFNGPPESGHGGYVCGVVAGLIGDSAEVSLRRPPPLERALTVRRIASGVEFHDGETLVAQGAPARVEVEVPVPVGLAEAERAAEAYSGFARHAFPTCFGCGPRRAAANGLRIFPGRVPGREVVAAPWAPDPSLADASGHVRPELVWAAMDCPGGWAVTELLTPQTIVLGRFAARLILPVAADARYVLLGWPIAMDGRKCQAGTALLSAAGDLHAVGIETWVTIAA